jgi:hypothetical protein
VWGVRYGEAAAAAGMSFSIGHTDNINRTGIEKNENGCTRPGEHAIEKSPLESGTSMNDCKKNKQKKMCGYGK